MYFLTWKMIDNMMYWYWRIAQEILSLEVTVVMGFVVFLCFKRML